MSKHTVSAIFETSDLSILDALVQKDASSRSAVIRKAVRLLHQQQPPSLFLPESSRNRLAGKVIDETAQGE